VNCDYQAECERLKAELAARTVERDSWLEIAEARGAERQALRIERDKAVAACVALEKKAYEASDKIAKVSCHRDELIERCSKHEHLEKENAKVNALLYEARQERDHAQREHTRVQCVLRSILNTAREHLSSSTEDHP